MNSQKTKIGIVIASVIVLAGVGGTAFLLRNMAQNEVPAVSDEPETTIALLEETEETEESETSTELPTETSAPPQGIRIRGTSEETTEPTEADTTAAENAEPEEYFIEEEQNLEPPEPVREVVLDNFYSPETWKQTLTGDALALYEELYMHFMQYDTVFGIRVDPDAVDIMQVASYVLEDHPEIFWYEYNYQWYPLNVTFGQREPELRMDNMFNIELQNRIPADQLNTAREELKNACAAVLSSIPENASDYEKVLYVHDYLVQYTVAATDAAIYYNAYDCLVQHSCMCNGYATAFSLLMHQLGVPCGRVLGGSWPNEYHIWDYVMINGRYYWVDPTWDDAYAYENLPVRFVNHGYFCMNDEQLLRNHTIDYSNSVFVPECISSDLNYFVNNGTYLETYNFEELDAIMKDHLVSGCVQVQFGSAEEMIRAEKDLFMNDAILKTSIYQGKQNHWHYGNESSRTLIVYVY